MVKFYLLSFVVIEDGKIIFGDSHLGYTTGPTTTKELIRNIQSSLENPKANVLLQSIQFLQREDYISLGGFIQPGL